jgi:hypothetical protein
MNALHASESAALRTMRRLLLAVLTVGMIGTAADLLLLEHYDGAWQLPPLVLIGLGLLCVTALWASAGPLVVTAMRVTMVCFIAAGLLGIVLHFNGNSEFQREIDPTLRGWELVAKVMRAKAPPALAPAIMIQMGLLGLLYTYRHPALQSDGVTNSLEGSAR